MITIDIASGQGPRAMDGYLHLSEQSGLGVCPDEGLLGSPIAVYK